MLLPLPLFLLLPYKLDHFPTPLFKHDQVLMLVLHLLLVFALLKLKFSEVVFGLFKFLIKFLDFLVIVSFLVQSLQSLFLLLLNPDETLVLLMQVLYLFLSSSSSCIILHTLSQALLLDVVASLKLAAHSINFLLIELNFLLGLFEFRFLLQHVLVLLSLLGHKPLLLPLLRPFNELLEFAREKLELPLELVVLILEFIYDLSLLLAHVGQLDHGLLPESWLFNFLAGYGGFVQVVDHPRLLLLLVDHF